jgi:hypothetical protein
MPRNDEKRRDTVSGRGRPVLSADLRNAELGACFLVENGVGGSDSRFATDPSLDDIETFGSLMDIVEIGDVMEGAEQLDQAVGSAADGVDSHHVAVLPDFGALTPRRESTGHRSPQSPTHTLLGRAYVIRHNLQTTNMGFAEDFHNIFPNLWAEE